MPLIVLGAMIGKVNEKIKLYEALLSNSSYSTCKQVFLAMLYAPYNLLILLAMLSIGLIVGLPLMLVFVWPAYFYNIRRFIRVMRYWAGKERYIAKV